jgi:hypothetical protein
MVKTGNKETSYDYKAHINVDEDRFVKSVKVMAGNVYDSQALKEILALLLIVAHKISC